jgi:hypothetical protein
VNGVLLDEDTASQPPPRPAPTRQGNANNTSYYGPQARNNNTQPQARANNGGPRPHDTRKPRTLTLAMMSTHPVNPDRDGDSEGEDELYTPILLTDPIHPYRLLARACLDTGVGGDFVTEATATRLVEGGATAKSEKRIIICVFGQARSSCTSTSVSFTNKVTNQTQTIRLELIVVHPT